MQLHRSLYDNYYDIGEWNMCQRIYKYGIWCDEECRSLDFFRTDLWSGSDILLLSIMSVFITAMMLLVVAKRLKAQQKARIYGDDQPMPGLPPFGMAIIFAVIMAVIVTLAKLKFVNETLVFAVVTCILLFIYMLKLTLFENRRPVLLAAPRHDMFDNPLDDHLFD
jgi:undecaprenyl pyrophosphate phosphatase UppP